MTTDRERHQAEQNEAQAQQPKARIISIRPSNGVILVTPADPEGFIRLVRAETADAPGLEVLGADDRSKIAGALLTLHQREQEPGPHAA